MGLFFLLVPLKKNHLISFHLINPKKIGKLQHLNDRFLNPGKKKNHILRRITILIVLNCNERSSLARSAGKHHGI